MSGQKVFSNRQSLGICIGATTISIVKTILDENNNILVGKVESVINDGDLKSALSKVMSNFESGLPTVITGREFRNRLDLTSISESLATEEALEFFINNGESFSAVASLGAETSLSGITSLPTKNLTIISEPKDSF